MRPLRSIYFEENRHDPACFTRNPVNRSREFHRTDSVQHRKIGQGFSHLVSLQVPDHMPFRPRPNLGNLRQRGLYPVFAEVFFAKFQQRTNHVDADGFCYNYDVNPGGLAPGAPGRIGNPAANLIYILAQLFVHTFSQKNRRNFYCSHDNGRVNDFNTPAGVYWARNNYFRKAPLSRLVLSRQTAENMLYFPVSRCIISGSKTDIMILEDETLTPATFCKY
jgi:hypothetical protein